MRGNGDVMSVEGTAQIVEQDYVSLQVLEQPTGPNVKVEYHTLNGNSPKSNKNYIGLWQSPNGVVPKKKAMWSYLLPNDDSEATVTLRDTPINDNAFVIGYCQTGDPKLDLTAATNVSATAVIHKGSDIRSEIPVVMRLEVKGDSVNAELFYTVLRGTDYSKHWFGIWKENASIDYDAPFYDVLVKEADSQKTGNIVFDNVSFQRGTEYTLAYFADGYSDNPAKEKNVSNMMGYIKFSF